jgi:hypothetical protein
MAPVFLLFLRAHGGAVSGSEECVARARGATAVGAAAQCNAKPQVMCFFSGSVAKKGHCQQTALCRNCVTVPFHE